MFTVKPGNLNFLRGVRRTETHNLDKASNSREQNVKKKKKGIKTEKRIVAFAVSFRLNLNRDDNIIDHGFLPVPFLIGCCSVFPFSLSLLFPLLRCFNKLSSERDIQFRDFHSLICLLFYNVFFFAGETGGKETTGET